MPDEPHQPPGPIERWPCGLDCQYATALAGTYGDWIWCTHPKVGGRLMRDGLECAYFRAQGEPAPLPPVEKPPGAM